MILSKNRNAFTLIEILLVVAILSILLVVVFAALNPAQRLMDTRNARRWNDVNQILTAVHTCIVDNDLATCGLTENGNAYQLGTCTGTGAALCTGAEADCLDLSQELVDYLQSIPLDPSDGLAATTAYSITVGTNGIITVSACSAEDNETISVSR